MSTFTDYNNSNVFLVTPDPVAQPGRRMNGNFRVLGSATSLNTAGTLVKRDGSGNFAAGTLSVAGLVFGYNPVYQINEFQIQVGGHLSVAEEFAVGGVATNAYQSQFYTTAGFHALATFLGGAAFSGAVTMNDPLRVANYTVATLPTAGTPGRVAYATDALKPGETTGTGTGRMVEDDGTGWFTGDGLAVAA